MTRRMHRWLEFVLVLCALALLSPSSLHAQQSTERTPLPAAASSTGAQPAGPQGYQPPPSVASEALSYARARHRLYFGDFLYSIMLLVLLIRWRIAPRFRDWAERASPNGFLQALIFSPLFILTMDVLSLPSAVWAHSLARQYHESIQGWGSWLLDSLKGEAIGLAIAVVLVWIFYTVVRKSPKRWWLYSWLALLPVLVLLFFVSPFLIEPLFFQYRPLEQAQPALSAEIEQLVRHAGLDIPQDRIFEMTASAKLNSVNAYVTGIGASKRVVIWDTTIEKMTPPEILFVVGHEMGHYVLHHLWKGMAAAAVAILIFLFIGHRALSALLARAGGRWGIRGPGDLASLPVLLLLLSLFTFLLTPIGNAVSRYIEHQADQFGLEVVHGVIPNPSDAAAGAFEILGEVDLEAPNPTWIEKVWFYDHPPLDERIRFARSYDPWSNGQSPEFVK